MPETNIILQGKQAKLWAMMLALDALGAFDVVFGSVTINFDGQGKISNVELKKNFKVTEFSTF